MSPQPFGWDQSPTGYNELDLSVDVSILSCQAALLVHLARNLGVSYYYQGARKGTPLPLPND